MPPVPHMFEIETLAQLREHAPAISAVMGSHGFCLMRGLPNDGDTIVAVAEHFGDIQRHIRADSRGVCGDAPMDCSWQKYVTEYRGVGAEEFLPHTDGSFVDGLLVEGDTAKRVTPPRLLLVQVAQRAESGGDNMVSDGGEILRYLAREELEVARILLRPGCITISRDDQMALEAAVFEPTRNGTLKMRFRYDNTVYAPSWARDALIRFHELTLDARFSTEVATDQGDIMVFDNWRVLHGRRIFSDAAGGKTKRRFRRVWISDDDTEVQMNMADEAHSNRSQEPYLAYATIKSPVPADRKISFTCGISQLSIVVALQPKESSSRSDQSPWRKTSEAARENCGLVSGPCAPPARGTAQAQEARGV